MELTPLSPELLDEYLAVLREHQVDTFTCPAFTVTLLPMASDNGEVKSEIKQAQERREAARNAPVKHGVYSHPAIRWPGGTPPTFPRNDSDE